MSREYTERSNYYSDHRVRAAERGSMFNDVDEKRMVATVSLFNGNDEEEHEVPITFEVCPTCAGKGTHVNPSVDSNGLTAEDFAEDPDFAEEYMRGTYDVQCYECHGKRVVPIVAKDSVDPEIMRRLEKQQTEAEDFRRIQEAERRYGA